MIVPAEIDGFTVDVIGINVFKGDTITSLTLPETVLELRSNAVASCENLTSVTLPQSLVVINRMNFFSCNALSEVTIPAGVRYIGDASFRFCERAAQDHLRGRVPGDRHGLLQHPSRGRGGLCPGRSAGGVHGGL